MAALGKFTLGDFGKYMPELLKLGLPADTALKTTKAYSYRVRPGAVVLPGTAPSGVSMEAWSRTEGGAPFLYDFSFGYSDLILRRCGYPCGWRAVHDRALQQELGALVSRTAQMGWPKVRQMNRPIPVASAPAATSSPVQAKAPAGFNTSATAPVNPLDEKYAAAPPAYIKHYEADNGQSADQSVPAGCLERLPRRARGQGGALGSSMPAATSPSFLKPPILTGAPIERVFRPHQSTRKLARGKTTGTPGARRHARAHQRRDPYDKARQHLDHQQQVRCYTKHNPDRSPGNHQRRHHDPQVVDPGKTPWGVFFLLEYSLTR
jgi:hypothetical protein